MNNSPQKKIENATPRSFFQAVSTVFRETEKSVGKPIERFYNIAGFSVRLRFAGPTLMPFITPALEHLATEAVDNPSLTICFFDSVSTQAVMPVFPWTKDAAWQWHIKPIGGQEDNSIKANYNFGRGILSLLDMSSNVGFYLVRDAQQIPYYEKGAPMMPILHWWMLIRGRQLTHGGAIGTEKGGVLLIGKSGSGKSTAALSSLNSGLFYAGDDYCLFSNDPEPYIHSLYSSAKVNPDNLKNLLSHMQNLVSNKDHLDSEKALLFLNEYFPDKMINGFPCRAILIPQISNLKETRLTKTSAAVILKNLVPNTIFQLNNQVLSLGGEVDIKNFGNLVRQIPGYILEVGTNLSGIPLAIQDLLNELRA
ncbi:MAG: serine kinase [Candidatus Omnitrophica bacterium]|nr:serine kinase [Candidatus Omnitrophota bacterium]